jgi:oligoendopeptidase F
MNWMMTMSDQLPLTAQEFMNLEWKQIEPFFHELETSQLDDDHLDDWLLGWTRLASLFQETYARLYVATTVNTNDARAEQRFQAFLDDILPPARASEQKLKEKLLQSGLKPAGFEIQLRNMQMEADLFREENLPLLSEEQKLDTRYDRIIGAQTVSWEGKELTLLQLIPVLQDTDREKRKRAWRLGAERQLADRKAINDLWAELLAVRLKIAANAGMPDYRAYRWRELLRFDYTPQDCLSFHQAIEAVVVPAAERIYEKRRKQLGVERLRPWDLDVDPLGRPPLRPFQSINELEEGAQRIFNLVDAQLGAYFQTMRNEDLLDLDNRIGKAPGGYCIDYPVAKRPFIFANSVGLHNDVQTLLHEGGHAFHAFESSHLPYNQQLQVPSEFAEVASMGMELLAAPYLGNSQGGFYSEVDAARARIEHLETSICFWPYMAVVDAFQHWVYQHPQQAVHPDQCDAQWSSLWQRFMRGQDWSDLEAEMMTGWHRKLHIHQIPFYYVEYGLAQMGAMQVWRNALQDQGAAVKAYRQALSLGSTVGLPELYRTAGAKFAFDAQTLGEVVHLAEETIQRLEAVHGLDLGTD